MRNLKIFWNDNGQSPYSNNTSGDMLATLNYATRGKLFELTPDNTISPSLVKNFQTNDNQDEFILTLRECTFHNGRRANAEDLAFSISRGFFSSQSNFYSTFLSEIKGVNDINPNSTYDLSSIGVEIIDELTVKIKINNPNPNFLHNLTSEYFSLVPREELEEDFVTWKNGPIGAGRYKINTPFDGEKTVLESIDDAENLISIYSKNVENGYDISFSDPNENSLSLNDTYYSSKPISMKMFSLSNAHKLSTNENFRNALKHLFNREELSNGENTMLNQVLPEKFIGKSESVFKYNLEKAKKEVEMIPEDLKNQEYQISYYQSKAKPDHSNFMKKVETQFKEAGLNFTFQSSRDKFESEKTAQEFPLRLSSMITNYSDPMVPFSAYRTNGPFSNYTFSGKEASDFEELFELANNSKSYEEKKANIKKISDFSFEKVLNVPLTEEKMVFYYDNNKIESFGNQNNPLVLDFSQITLKK